MDQPHPIFVRLMARSVITDAGCYEWQGTADRSGYGKTSFQGRFASTHRLAYKHLGPEFDHQLTLDHLCKNRRCWRIDHLEPVTMQTNVHRGDGWAGLNARATHCRQGHEFTPANTRVRQRPDKGTAPQRQCRQCDREHKAAARRRHPAA